MDVFRLHGDNIVECERIMDLIIMRLNPSNLYRGFVSLACPYVDVDFSMDGENKKWRFEMFPGFNKNTRDRWNASILNLLKQNGSFLDETPDVILTHVQSDLEEIILAIEFCSALQAGNQAWQRSGRAYSTGRTRYPYIYIVDFVKYELNNISRNRKNLRFPNPAVPYSYISHSRYTNNFIIQAYFKAEEFQPSFDSKLKYFDEIIFAEYDVADYIVLKLMKKDTTGVERTLISKNLKMVKFLSQMTKDGTNFTSSEWEKLNGNEDSVVDFSISLNRFKFKKKIAEKSMAGYVKEFNRIVQKYSIGMASTDLPFGIIKRKDRTRFADEICKLYNISDANIVNGLKQSEDLVVCMLKGFKPRGDDNRPDRGALPLISMLGGENTQVLTFIYGPLIKSNLDLIDNNILELARRNGLWKSFISLSNFMIVDCPVIGQDKNAIRIINNTMNKQLFLNIENKDEKVYVDTKPNQYQENDVDTVIHSIFKHIIPNCFEGMCNPPGGDWSGMSIIHSNHENRWLSLPRVSEDGKRPDHVLELFGLFDKPILLSIESKEKPSDLEDKIGIQLKRYIEYLLDFKPSVTRNIEDPKWKIADSKIDFHDFICLSVGAFIVNDSFGEEDFRKIFESSSCDILIGMIDDKTNNKWVLKMRASNKITEEVIKYISDNVRSDSFDTCVFKIDIEG